MELRLMYLEKPENACNLPVSASPIIWDMNRTPIQKAAKVGILWLKILLSPGHCLWRSFSGRWICGKILRMPAELPKHTMQKEFY